MARLTHRNLQKLQHCIREIYSDLNEETLHANLLAAIARVIPASSIGYAEVNVSKIELSKNVIEPFVALSSEEAAAFERHLPEHPLMPLIYPNNAQPHTGKLSGDASAYTGKALRIHDLLTKTQFRRLGLYNEFYRKLNIEYQMIVLLYCGRFLNKNLAVNRDRRDFTEEERLTLNLLVPHILQAFKNAEAYKKARQTFAALESTKLSLKAQGLTGREEDVLFWVAQGKTNVETARILKMAPGTVKVHLERIYQKLGVENRTSAAMLAHGLARKNRRM